MGLVVTSAFLAAQRLKDRRAEPARDLKHGDHPLPRVEAIERC
jgi:hypothetical protein